MRLPPRLDHRLARLRREARDRVLGRGEPDLKVVREDLAVRYLRGSGIEIGALNFPMRVPPGVHVRYVDRQSGEELRAEYGAMYPGVPIVAPDVLDDGERLATFADGSLDFVIANHMLEHTEDPVGTLRHHVRVLRPGGVLFLALPHPVHTFDAPRERTTVEHVLRDHAEGPERSRRGHYEDWARNVREVAEDDLPEYVRTLEAERANIHFHVWEPQGFLAMIAAAELPATLECLLRTGHEYVVILRRDPVA